MSEQHKKDLRRAVLLIRYRTDKPSINSRKYVSYRIISNIVSLTSYEVQHICRKALLPAKVITFA